MIDINDMDDFIEYVEAELNEKLEDAKESYEDNKSISINAYGTGYDKGYIDALEDCMNLMSSLLKS